MNEFERKLYLKYRNIENMTQLLCLKLYRLRLYTSKRTSFFTFLLFLNALPEFEDFGYTLTIKVSFFPVMLCLSKFK